MERGGGDAILIIQVPMAGLVGGLFLVICNHKDSKHEQVGFRAYPSHDQSIVQFTPAELGLCDAAKVMVPAFRGAASECN